MINLVILKSLIISAVPFLPVEVTFTGSRDKDVDIFWRVIIQYTKQLK